MRPEESFILPAGKGRPQSQFFSALITYRILRLHYTFAQNDKTIFVISTQEKSQKSK